MTRNMLTHYNPAYGMDVDYRNSGRLSAPGHDRSYGHSRANPRNDPMAGRQQQQVRSSISHSPVQSNNAGGQRRRIPVACARCRKRKIRCSGDPGDTTGCSNCQSAHQSESCIFLRVSSSQVDLSPSYSSATSALSTSPHGMGLGMHVQGSFSTPSLGSTLSSQNSMRHLGSGYGGNSGTTHMGSKIYNQDTLSSNGLYDPSASIPLSSRSIYESLGNDFSGPSDSGIAYILHSNTEPGSSLAEPSPAILPSQSDYPRWSSISTSGKSTASGYYMESDAATGMGNMSHVMSSFMQPSNTRVSSSMDSYSNLFPALSPLQSSLPDAGSRPPLTDKLLPPLPQSRIPTSADFSMKICGSFTDSSGASSTHSRSSTSTRRSPTTNYMPPSPPSMQLPSSERSTPTLSGSGSNYIASSSSSLTVGLNGNLYPHSIEQMPVHTMLKHDRGRTDSELMQSTPRSSAHIPTPSLRSNSTSSNSSYQTAGEQHRALGLNKLYP